MEFLSDAVLLTLIVDAVVRASVSMGMSPAARCFEQTIHQTDIGGFLSSQVRPRNFLLTISQEERDETRE
jgi:hypothetical protein